MGTAQDRKACSLSGAQNMMSESPTNPAINVAAALECTDGDTDLLQSLIELYFDQQPSLIEQIRNGIESRDANLLERGAHSLKGAISVFAAANARKAAFDLENIGKESNWEIAQSAWEQLRNELQQFEPALRELNDSIARGELAEN